MADLASVRITKDNVYFDGQPLPRFIAEDGVLLKPGGGKNINRLTVTFIVGEVVTEDPTDSNA
jgi:hypothetical protein